METVFGIFPCLGVIVLLCCAVGTSSGLTCDEYDDQECKGSPDKTGKKCRAVSAYCDQSQSNPTCFAFWEETEDGLVVIQKQGCWHAEPRCSRSLCGNARDDHLHFCCCTGNNCNKNVLLADLLPRPNATQLLWHEWKASNKGSTAGRRPVFPSVTAASVPLTGSPVGGPGSPVGGPASKPFAADSAAAGGSPITPVTQIIIAVIIVVCAVLAAGGTLILCRIYRRRELDTKKAPYDLESALAMAPLMSKEYENQDGCVLLRNLQLLEKKALGRYGEVWRGRLGESIVAVKITPAAEIASWKNEVHIYHKFLMPNPHLNILRFILSGHKPAENRMFLVTEYQPLGSLVDLLKGRTVTNDEAERVMCSMLAGMAFLHDSDGKPAIAHRDFKSTNVLIKSDLTACIADFGLATSFEADERIGDKHGQVGTRRYMAPELLEGAISLNVVSFLRVDVYACGLVLWEILSRTQLTPEETVGIFKLPLEEELGTAPTNEAVQTAVVHKRLRPVFKPSWLSNSRNTGLCLTIEECWDADPEARPSASCLLNRMRQLSAGVTINECCDRTTSSASAPPVTWSG